MKKHIRSLIFSDRMAIFSPVDIEVIPRIEGNSMTNQQKEQIRTMRLQGVGYIKIGKALGISDNTVRSFCRRNGLGDKSKNAVACKQCGKLIKNIPKQKPKKFCSDACRNTWWNEHRDCVNRKANYEYICTCCGRNFTAYGNNHRKYCSHACYITDRFRKGHISDE